MCRRSPRPATLDPFAGYAGQCGAAATGLAAAKKVARESFRETHSEFRQPEADGNRFVDLLHGRFVDPSQTLDQPDMVDRPDLIEKCNGCHREPGRLIRG